MRTVAEVLKALPTQPESGLSADAAAKSRAQFGANRLTPLPREPLWQKFIEKFDEPIIKILLAAALLSMAVDIFKHHTLTGSICFGALIGAIAVAYALKQGAWVPTLMLATAVVYFI